MGSSRTYRATGINLKSMPLGESDRIVTLLTKEFGLVRAVAKGARKTKSSLGGRTEPFVVNDLSLAKGRSLDRIAQAETLCSFSGLRSGLAKLTVAQYWAELVLHQALSQQPQEEIFAGLLEHLERLAAARSRSETLPLLGHGIYHLLAIAGVAPQVHRCHYCRCRVGLRDREVKSDREFLFSPASGGVLCDACEIAQRPERISVVSAATLAALQVLPNAELPERSESPTSAWLGVEQVLHRTIQYQFDRTIQSSTLVASCFRSQMPVAT
ncbi:MAG: DNA repair protein RecO [Cyanobacteria bacterium J06648_11]